MHSEGESVAKAGSRMYVILTSAQGQCDELKDGLTYLENPNATIAFSMP